MKKFMFLVMAVGLFSSLLPVEAKASAAASSLSAKAVPVTKNATFIAAIEEGETATTAEVPAEQKQMPNSKKPPISNGGIYLSAGAVIIIILLLILIL
jgi:hypothetical protein